MLKNKPRKRINLSDQPLREIVDVPNLLELQTKSFQRFIKEGLKEEFANISPVIGYGAKYELEFLEGYYLEDPEVSYEECKKREITYAASLKVPVRLAKGKSL